MYLFKYLSIDAKATAADKELARNHISAAHQIFMSLTVSGAASRAAYVIELLGRKGSGADEQNSSSHRSYRGASLCYEAFCEAEQIKVQLLSRRKASMPIEDDVGRGQIFATTVTAPMTDRHPRAITDRCSAAEVPPQDPTRTWGLPWSMWDINMYDNTLMVGHAEPNFPSMEGWWN